MVLARARVGRVAFPMERLIWVKRNLSVKNRKDMRCMYRNPYRQYPSMKSYVY